ncbi:hypothetical protein HanXRQr2_Chr15g0711991 [Helianthus annuus]|uniref:Uncharacterized protein n=1 Tax=Helianthus annuus TaxID=4232 RepID=A0A9K3E3D3_HELAN|nr:hypothetical protein HanXRQr2_Chr15g0711991 [Helianthus annuus]KAJ0457537.1 hypothetical protein HanIR_Chr15g0774801 [Helianthus annuus]KAJ0474500.1 hypothetical protein HanHA89_Chr15g0630371 [Helianthus annuus]KAJ0832850.1 hypothetical protein HanPSC8_Chr15g0683401 [Helianthus annuus]
MNSTRLSLAHICWAAQYTQKTHVLFYPSPTSSHQFFTFKFIRETEPFEGAGEQYGRMREGDPEPATGDRTSARACLLPTDSKI